MKLAKLIVKNAWKTSDEIHKKYPELRMGEVMDTPEARNLTKTVMDIINKTKQKQNESRRNSN